MRNVLTAMALVLGFVGAVTVQARAPDASVEVKMDQGVLTGRQHAAVRAFLGIPYAAPPTGERRWRKPGAAPQSAPNRSNDAKHGGSAAAGEAHPADG